MIDEKNKQLLTKAIDRISFLYIEYAKLEQSEFGIQIRREDKIAEVPITTITCLILGPGTSITHRAVENIAKAGCSICWMGSDLAVFYTYGLPTTEKAKNILTQAKFHESKMLHTEVIHKMFEYRYPDSHIKSKTIQELRGMEGQRVKAVYNEMAQKYQVPWSGRRYNLKNFDGDDLVNKYLSALNHVFYAITCAVIQMLGYSPALGFIHTGHVNAFVFDVADLFKEELTIPLAFKLASDTTEFDRNRMLTEYRSELFSKKIVKRMVDIVTNLFYNDSVVETELTFWD